MRRSLSKRRRGTVLLMIVGLLAMLFMIISAYITLARFDRLSLAQADKGAKVEQVLDGVNDVLIGSVANTWSDAAGDVYFGGARYADVPGGPGMEWLASNSPACAVAGSTRPSDYIYPAVTSLTTAATNASVASLMFDNPGGANTGDARNPNMVLVDPGNSNAVADTTYNALRSYMDADGDGIADSLFAIPGSVARNPPGTYVLTEMANAMDGRTVRTTGLDLASVSIDELQAASPTLGPNFDRARAWQAFQMNARYLAAARIISHGGMVSIGVPLPGTAATAWNTVFTQEMFRWVQYPTDSTMAPNNTTLNNIWAARGTIEPLLRLRGGLLAGEQGDDPNNFPLALQNLANTYWNTFIPYSPGHWGGTFRPSSTQSWQRFNLADKNDWNCWRQAVSMDASLYNSGSIAPRRNFVCRQSLTANNTSDELARDQTSSLPRVDKFLVTVSPGVVPGQPKFYLGDISKAFTSGQFNDSGANPPGFQVIDKLAGYYNEMLSDYTVAGNPGLSTSAERLKQAYMLAVNTVAFAAPRDLSVAKQGYIDVVYREYTDPGSGQQTLCVGYAPQPFITQVVAYNDPKDLSGQIVPRIALGIELYNPNDPDPQQWGGGRFNTSDQFALNLSQFYLTLKDPNTPIWLNSTYKHLSGRSMMVIAVNDSGSNTAFDIANGTYTPDVNSGIAVDVLDPSGTPPARHIDVHLWRTNAAGTMAVQVDKLSLEVPSDLDKKWIAKAQRDTTPSTSYGGPAVTTGEAGWRVVVDDLSSQKVEHDDRAVDDALNPWRDELGAASASAAPKPATPLCIMNAGTGINTLFNGVKRPDSFPTVGFLLFVPRYAHLYDGATWKCIGEQLEEEYVARGKSVPCDFGHMPVFDNTTKVNAASDFKSGTSGVGRVPWGQFVFDYFTTLDPNLVDIYRVPGRININTASWYVLAGLPVLGPNSGDITKPLPLVSRAAPEFWSDSSGVLVGIGRDLTPRRFVTGDLRLEVDQVGGQYVWRLGADLGQAAASYRDQQQYAIGSSLGMLDYASQRNSTDPTNTFLYRPNGAPYGEIRGHGGGTRHPGFLTIGELANVVGFDSSTFTALNDPSGLQSPVATGDFMKAVSLVALLDSQFLTTRSNVFTIYSTLLVLDPEDTQASIRSQVTIDRTNLLPRTVFSAGTPLFEWKDLNNNKTWDPGESVPMLIENTGQPEIIGRRQIAYFNARYED